MDKVRSAPPTVILRPRSRCAGLFVREDASPGPLGSAGLWPGGCRILRQRTFRRNASRFSGVAKSSGEHGRPGCRCGRPARNTSRGASGEEAGQRPGLAQRTYLFRTSYLARLWRERRISDLCLPSNVPSSPKYTRTSPRNYRAPVSGAVEIPSAQRHFSPLGRTFGINPRNLI
jgi:hypothetical protein